VSVTIAIHSCKGGTGKTSIGINLAAAYSLLGKNVCFLDFDSKATSFFLPFDFKSKKWINDVLLGKCGIMDVIYEIDEYDKPGKLHVGLSNPDISAIREISSKDRKWQAHALKMILNAKRDLTSAGMDVIILDTSPGVDFASINAVAASDFVIVLLKPIYSSLRCTEQVVNGVYKLLDKPCGIIENMCHESYFLNPVPTERFGIPVLATIPCMCDVSIKIDTQILTLEEQEHSFSESIFNVAGKIMDELD
jgi:MinD-like ATPase involved in chromosome partitioning or flagellar assembly